jgi:DNA polymerase
VEQGGALSGWNVIGFDRHVWDLILVKQHGFPPIEGSKWLDSIHLASMANMPRSLDKCASALNVPYVGDLKDSARIKRITNKNKSPWMKLEDAQWLLQRCQQDVLMEADIYGKLPPWPQVTPWKRIREIDRRINDRGVMLDLPLVHGLQEMCVQETKELNLEMARITKDEVGVISKVEDLKRWLLKNGVPVPHKGDRVGGEKEEGDEDDEEDRSDSPYRLRTKDIESLLARNGSDFYFEPHVERALEIRRAAAKASTKKLIRMIESADPNDWRVRNVKVLGGAQATMRWSSSLVQLDNLPREVLDMGDFEDARKLALARDIDAIRDRDWRPNGKNEGERLSILQFASMLLRRLLMVPDGDVMPYADLSQIEARLTVWMSGEHHVTEAFRANKDVYKMQAASAFGCRPEDILDDSLERQIGKVMRLFLGFLAGVNAFIPAAMNAGVRLSTARAGELVKGFRATNPTIVELGDNMDDAAISAITTPRREFPIPPLNLAAYYYDGTCLYLKLPSGRAIRYWRPRLQPGKWQDGSPKKKPDLTALAIKGKAVYRRTLWRGLKIENMIQGMGADILGEGLLNLEDAGLPVIAHVHDAAASQVSNHDHGDLKSNFVAAMTGIDKRTYPGFPIAAKASVNQRFG